MYRIYLTHLATIELYCCGKWETNNHRKVKKMRYMFVTGLYSWFCIARELDDISQGAIWYVEFIEEIEDFLMNFSSTELSDIVEYLKTEVEPEIVLDCIAKANG